MTDPRATEEAATARLAALDATAVQPASGALQAPVPAAPQPPSPAAPATPALAAPGGRQQCPACACAVAPDQRYCVECGQRLAHARPAFVNTAQGAPPGGSPQPPKKSRFQMSPNTALIAGVATLLIALGIGVYIGSLTKGSSSPREVVTTPTAAPTGTTGTGTTGTGTTGPTGGTSKPTSSTSPGAKASTKPTAAPTKPPNPTVQVGQKSNGPGSQHGKFTGHFFGGENEEDAGEEGEEESGSSSKGGKKK